MVHSFIPSLVTSTLPSGWMRDHQPQTEREIMEVKIQTGSDVTTHQSQPYLWLVSHLHVTYLSLLAFCLLPLSSLLHFLSPNLFVFFFSFFLLNPLTLLSLISFFLHFHLPHLLLFSFLSSFSSLLFSFNLHPFRPFTADIFPSFFPVSFFLVFKLNLNCKKEETFYDLNMFIQQVSMTTVHQCVCVCVLY